MLAGFELQAPRNKRIVINPKTGEYFLFNILLISGKTDM